MKKLLINLLRSSLVVLFLIATAYGQIKVSYAGGEAYFNRDGQRQRISTGMALKPGDTIVTGKRSFVALLFDDGSVHKVAANTQYEIQDYRNTKDSRFQVFRIIKGKIFSFVSKTFKKSDIKFLTPTAVVGVRGTAFVTDVGPEGTTVYMIEGRVALAPVSGSRVGPAVPLSQGEKGQSKGGQEIKKEAMEEQDYEKAAKDVPVSLAEVTVDEGSANAEEEGEENSEKELARSYVDEAVERVDQQRADIVENKVWDHRSGKKIGKYEITQVVKKPADNQIQIVNHTYDTSSKRQHSLEVGIVFEQAIPSAADVSTGVTRDIDTIDWRISVSEGNAKDELFYSRDYKNRSDTIVSFNGEEGNTITSTDYQVKGANVRIPKLIKFYIDGNPYKFDFSYDYINSDGDAQGGIVQKEDNEIYRHVLSGDYSTRISVEAILPVGGNVLRSGLTQDAFRIILLNGYLIPLFNATSS